MFIQNSKIVILAFQSFRENICILLLKIKTCETSDRLDIIFNSLNIFNNVIIIYNSLAPMMGKI